MCAREFPFFMLFHNNYLLPAKLARTHAVVPAEAFGERHDIDISKLLRYGSHRICGGSQQIACPLHTEMMLKFLRGHFHLFLEDSCQISTADSDGCGCILHPHLLFAGLGEQVDCGLDIKAVRVVPFFIMAGVSSFFRISSPNSW